MHGFYIFQVETVPGIDPQTERVGKTAGLDQLFEFIILGLLFEDWRER